MNMSSMEKVPLEPDLKVITTPRTNSVNHDMHEGSVASISIDPIAEAAVLKKFDQIVLPQCFVFLILCYLDRSNIGNAKVFGFATDLGLVGNQFGNISTFFYIPYIIFETPWVMCIKRFGPNKVLAVALTCWSIVTLCTGFIQNYTQAVILRCLLGLFEAGVAPGFAFIFSTIYPRQGTTKRVALIYLANVTSGAFGGLFAYGIQSMGERRGLAAWRWLFILEGIISIVICGLCWLSFPNAPETAWFLSSEEKYVMEQRKLRDAVYKGNDKFEWRYAREAVTDPFIYLASLAFFCSSIAIFGFGTFLPTIIEGLGYSAYQANYLSVPVYAFGAITLCITSYLSDKLNRKAIFLMILPIPVILGYLISVGTSSAVAGYVGMFLCCGGIYSFNSTILTWVTINLVNEHTRSVGLGLFVSLGNLSGLVASQLYPSAQGPRYVMGNAVSAGMEALALGVVVVIWWMLKRKNRRMVGVSEEGDGCGKQDRTRGFAYAL